jgi:hypothetical protein
VRAWEWLSERRQGMHWLVNRLKRLIAVWLACWLLTVSLMAWGYEEVEVPDGGVIAGDVKFAGTPPTGDQMPGLLLCVIRSIK